MYTKASIYIFTQMMALLKMFCLDFEKGKAKGVIDDMPKEKLMLANDGKKLPKNVMVQVRFAPLEFVLFEY